MAVDFTPNMREYTNQGKFRYWVQMVLPTIYDDSLSYMELLNKVVYVINLAIEDVDAVEDNVAALLTAFEQLQQYTNDYFDNLDVQEEINNKLDEMAASGDLNEILDPVIIQSVSNWLAEHITPTSPAVDNTLTISGAAADSKTVGLKTLQTFNDALNESNDLNDILKSGTYYTGSTLPANIPVNSGGRLLVMSTSTGTLSRTVQIYFALNGSTFYRSALSNTWYEWYEVTRKTDLESKFNFAMQTFDDALNELNDLNDILKSGTYYTGSTLPANIPVNSGGRLLVMSTSTGTLSRTVQIYIAFNDKLYYRQALGDTWYEWYEVTRKTDLESKFNFAMQTFDALGASDDLDNVLKSGTYYTGSTLPANIPVNSGGRLLVLTTSGGIKSRTVQIYIAFNNKLYYRYALGDTWYEWNETVRTQDAITPDYFVTSSVSMFNTIGCLGDSFTAGYLYNKPDSPYYDPDYAPNGVYPEISYPAIMGRIYGVNVTNYGSSGATSKYYEDNVLPTILQDAPKELYIISLGLNDRTQEIPIGQISDITGNVNSAIGNIGRIINALKQHAPHSKIILLKSLWVLTANTSNISPYYTYIDSVVTALSDYYSIPFIETLNDAYFGSPYYNNNQKGLHPTAPLYAGIGKRIGELIGKCIADNNDYFYNYYPVD